MEIVKYQWIILIFSTPWTILLYFPERWGTDYPVMQPHIPGNENLNVEVKTIHYIWNSFFYKETGIERCFVFSCMLRTSAFTRTHSPVICKDTNWPERKADESLPKSVEIRMHGVSSSIPQPPSRSDIYENKQLYVYIFIMLTIFYRLKYSN